MNLRQVNSVVPLRKRYSISHVLMVRSRSFESTWYSITAERVVRSNTKLNGVRRSSNDSYSVVPLRAVL